MAAEKHAAETAALSASAGTAEAGVGKRKRDGMYIDL